MVKIFDYQLGGVVGGFFGFLIATILKGEWYHSFLFAISMIIGAMIINWLSLEKEAGK